MTGGLKQAASSASTLSRYSGELYATWLVLAFLYAAAVNVGLDVIVPLVVNVVDTIAVASRDVLRRSSCPIGCLNAGERSGIGGLNARGGDGLASVLDYCRECVLALTAAAVGEMQGVVVEME